MMPPGAFLFTYVNWERRRKLKIIIKFFILIEKNSSYFPHSLPLDPLHVSTHPMFYSFFLTNNFQNTTWEKKQQKQKQNKKAKDK